MRHHAALLVAQAEPHAVPLFWAHTGISGAPLAQRVACGDAAQMFGIEAVR